MHTEEEAKGKWCPFSRTVTVGRDDKGRFVEPSWNRAYISTNDPDHWFDLNPEGCRCIASACMAWRWIDPGYYNPTISKTQPLRRGYCGLAGAPLNGH